MLSMTHSRATYAYQRLVEGAVLESAGERRTAIRRYTEAFDLYVKFGYKRRAVCAARHSFQMKCGDEVRAARAQRR